LKASPGKEAFRKTFLWLLPKKRGQKDRATPSEEKKLFGARLRRRLLTNKRECLSGGKEVRFPENLFDVNSQLGGKFLGNCPFGKVRTKEKAAPPPGVLPLPDLRIG